MILVAIDRATRHSLYARIAPSGGEATAAAPGDRLPTVRSLRRAEINAKYRRRGYADRDAAAHRDAPRRGLFRRLPRQRAPPKEHYKRLRAFVTRVSPGRDRRFSVEN